MIELIWDESFTRTLKKWRKKHPELVDRFQQKLELFKNEPFHPSLKIHSLVGNLADSFAISINYSGFQMSVVRASHS